MFSVLSYANFNLNHVFLAFRKGYGHKRLRSEKVTVRKGYGQKRLWSEKVTVRKGYGQKLICICFRISLHERIRSILLYMHNVKNNQFHTFPIQDIKGYGHKYQKCRYITITSSSGKQEMIVTSSIENAPLIYFSGASLPP
jgi:hypothetical protein